MHLISLTLTYMSHWCPTPQQRWKTKVAVKKKQKTYNFHLEWECEFFFTSMKDMCVYLICGSSVSVGKRGYVERNHTQVHSNFARDFPAGSTQRTEKVNQLKATLKKLKWLFIGPTKKANTATEASFKVAHILTKHKKPYTDGGMMKEAMTAVADTLFKDHKSKTEIMSATLIYVAWCYLSGTASICSPCRCSGSVGAGHDKMQMVFRSE